MELCSRLIVVFGRNFCEKQQIWVSEIHFGKVRGYAQPLLMARWQAHGQLFVHIN